ncbi:MAG: hypothetical protein CL494_07390 [Actinobacteria bacterium]|nr:hypothetical protein [Actinomycetota bacterium]
MCASKSSYRCSQLIIAELEPNPEPTRYVPFSLFNSRFRPQKPSAPEPGGPNARSRPILGRARINPEHFGLNPSGIHRFFEFGRYLTSVTSHIRPHSSGIPVFGIIRVSLRTEIDVITIIKGHPIFLSAIDTRRQLNAHTENT